MSAAGIAEIHAAINAPAVDPAIPKFRPIAGAVYSGLTGPHVKFAVRVAAERKLFFESIHGLGSLVQELGVTDTGDIYSKGDFEKYQSREPPCDREPYKNLRSWL